MDDVLLKYMDERLFKVEESDGVRLPGPVITISRVSGCSATLIAETLAAKINKLHAAKKTPSEWRWINKEILSLVSEELKISPKQAKQLVESQQKNLIQEIVASFTESYYAHSIRVKNTVERVVRNIAAQGNVIIVGRASGVITSDFSRALHINLDAPPTWRATVISMKRNMSVEDAKKYMAQMDYQRNSFKEFFMNKSDEGPDYDLTINCKSHSIEQICDIIIKEAKTRNLI